MRTRAPSRSEGSFWRSARRMPIELLLECTCSATRPGDVLVAVGDHPALGNWDPQRSRAVLSTSPAAFPRWEMQAPLLLNGGGDHGCDEEEEAEVCVEYKYAILRPGAAGLCRWEELSPEDSGGEGGQDLWEDGPRLLWEAPRAPRPEAGGGGEASSKPFNRTLLITAGTVLFRADDFGQCEPSASSAWPVCSDWAPAVAGGGTMLGRGQLRNSLNPAFELQYRFPLRIFVEPRRQPLRECAAELARRRHMPPGLWCRIMGFADSELALCCSELGEGHSVGAVGPTALASAGSGASPGRAGGAMV